MESTYKTQVLCCEGFPGGSVVKNLPIMQEMQVRSLGREALLEEEVGNSLQYFCLEEPMDGGAWWATVHGVSKSGTRWRD